MSEDPTPGIAAIAPRAAAELYGLEVIAADIADHDGNQTRFVAVARDGIPPRTGHDRTALVVYQRADEPGSLISILQEFAARRINLSNLISRPTKHGGLGDYCFIIFADGHVTDDLLADAMRALHAKQGDVKFFGSYPAADASDHDARQHADARWREADDWVSAIQRRVSGDVSDAVDAADVGGDADAVGVRARVVERPAARPRARRTAGPRGARTSARSSRRARRTAVGEVDPVRPDPVVAAVVYAFQSATCTSLVARHRGDAAQVGVVLLVGAVVARAD